MGGWGGGSKKRNISKLCMSAMVPALAPPPRTLAEHSPPPPPLSPTLRSSELRCPRTMAVSWANCATLAVKKISSFSVGEAALKQSSTAYGGRGREGS